VERQSGCEALEKKVIKMVAVVMEWWEVLIFPLQPTNRLDHKVSEEPP